MQSIILRDWEVRAALANKTVQVWRRVEMQPVREKGGRWTWWGRTASLFAYREAALRRELVGYNPCGAVGDHLWVREVWARVPVREPDGGQGDRVGIIYRADGEEALHQIPDEWELLRWRPAIHMPHTASRLTLRLDTVRVLRVQEITEEDAKATGIEPRHDLKAHEWMGIPPPATYSLGKRRGVERVAVYPHILGFRRQWCKEHGAKAWAANDWAWAMTLSVVP